MGFQMAQLAQFFPAWWSVCVLKVNELFVTAVHLMTANCAAQLSILCCFWGRAICFQLPGASGFWGGGKRLAASICLPLAGYNCECFA